MSSYEIKYDTSNVSEAQAKAIQDCKDWLGEKRFAILIEAFKQDIASTEPSSKQAVKVGLTMIGIQGYPAEVLVDTYFK